MMSTDALISKAQGLISQLDATIRELGAAVANRPADSDALIREALAKLWASGFNSTLWRKLPEDCLVELGRRYLHPMESIHGYMLELQAAGYDVHRTTIYRFAQRLRFAAEEVREARRQPANSADGSAR